MNTKLVCFFLLVSVVVAMAMPYEDEDDYNLFDQLMEKRARGKGNGKGRGRGQGGPDIVPCPGNERCFCAYMKKTGSYSPALTCLPSRSDVGI